MGRAAPIIPAIHIATVTRTKSLGKKLCFTHKKYTLHSVIYGPISPSKTGCGPVQ